MFDIETVNKFGYNLWEKTKAFFKRSETIFFARLQAFLGVVGGYVMWLSQNENMQSAIQTMFQPKFVPFWILGMGLLTETLRRRNATDL